MIKFKTVLTSQSSRYRIFYFSKEGGVKLQRETTTKRDNKKNHNKTASPNKNRDIKRDKSTTSDTKMKMLKKVEIFSANVAGCMNKLDRVGLVDNRPSTN